MIAPLCLIATDSACQATGSWEIFTELSKLHLAVSNAQRAEGSKVKGSYTGGFLQLCLYLLMTSPYFSGVPCTTRDRHPRSSPNSCQHQPRGELSDPRGGRHNQHGENIRSFFSGQVSIASFQVYSRLAEDARSDKNSMVSGGNNSVYARTGHPVSITGSLSRWANSVLNCVQIVSRVVGK